jgi:diguanylate cyclase
LSQAKTLESMQEIVGSAIRDTAQMAASSQRLEGQLKAATHQAEQLSHQLKQTQRQALVDALTGLANRRAFDTKLAELHEKFKADGDAFAVVMIDIDHFKRFNDTYGHKVGDAVLQVVGSVLKDCLTVEDYPARYGGEEFIVLLPGKSVDESFVVAEEIRRRMSEKRFRLAKSGRTIGQITVSLGIAVITGEDSQESVVERADKALYVAKNSGRNNVKSERDLEEAATATA